MVRFAAFAAWTRPGLAMTDKRCFKLTCLYQVRVFSRNYKQVELKLEGYSTFGYPIQYSYSIDPRHIKIVRIAILTISAKVFDVIKKGVSV